MSDAGEQLALLSQRARLAPSRLSDEISEAVRRSVLRSELSSIVQQRSAWWEANYFYYGNTKFLFEPE